MAKFPIVSIVSDEWPRVVRFRLYNGARGEVADCLVYLEKTNVSSGRCQFSGYTTQFGGHQYSCKGEYWWETKIGYLVVETG